MLKRKTKTSVKVNSLKWLAFLYQLISFAFGIYSAMDHVALPHLFYFSKKMCCFLLMTILFCISTNSVLNFSFLHSFAKIYILFFSIIYSNQNEIISWLVVQKVSISNNIVLYNLRYWKQRIFRLLIIKKWWMFEIISNFSSVD